jgi:hypothetical protein
MSDPGRARAVIATSDAPQYASWFPDAPPTRSVAKLGVELPGVLVSIRMTAFIG